ncbi:MAG: DUF1499 domain-containing protein [Bdellovibrionales bacterium]|nr:DUF1499 domain-containing protein [Bdellovibrionales bacterium]
MILFWLMNPINDISTQQPPVKFEAVSEMEQASKNEYDESFVKIQTKLYPDMRPLFTPGPRDFAFKAALEVAKKQDNWKLHLIDDENFIIQGTDTTALMKYTDDFVVRVEEGDKGGSLVQMRSKSRVGKSDLGKNADRINDFLDEVKKQLDKQ